MGNTEALLDLSKKPSVILMCGLQGAGKTTQCAKLARFLKRKGLCKNPLLAACDLQRPAAIQQLHTLGEQAGIPVFSSTETTDPIKVAKEALHHAEKQNHDLLIIDTAGRLHIDEELMLQLEQLKEFLKPSEVLFVANATTGQDAVQVAAAFDKRVAITGTILTMLDGNARAGAAISIKEVTGKPLKFEGFGEKLDDLQIFNPASMADRILGMGDTINLVKRAQEHIKEEDAKKFNDKIRQATFNYNDYLEQIQTIKKIGSFKGLMQMMPKIPGLPALPDTMGEDESSFNRMAAIMLSMTPEEREEKCELTIQRRKRLAKGSGNSIEEVNKFVKKFNSVKEIFKNKSNIKHLEKMLGGSLWR